MERKYYKWVVIFGIILFISGAVGIRYAIKDESVELKNHEFMDEVTGETVNVSVNESMTNMSGYDGYIMIGGVTVIGFSILFMLSPLIFETNNSMREQREKVFEDSEKHEKEMIPIWAKMDEDKRSDAAKRMINYFRTAELNVLLGVGKKVEKLMEIDTDFINDFEMPFGNLEAVQEMAKKRAESTGIIYDVTEPGGKGKGYSIDCKYEIPKAVDQEMLEYLAKYMGMGPYPYGHLVEKDSVIKCFDRIIDQWRKWGKENGHWDGHGEKVKQDE